MNESVIERREKENSLNASDSEMMQDVVQSLTSASNNLATCSSNLM